MCVAFIERILKAPLEYRFDPLHHIEPSLQTLKSTKQIQIKLLRILWKIAGIGVGAIVKSKGMRTCDILE